MKTKLLSFGLIGVISASIIAGIGFWAIANIHKSLNETVTTSQVLRNSMQADMMHDALRADIYAMQIAIQSANSKALEIARTDVEEHAKEFHDNMQNVLKVTSSDQIKNDLKSVIPKMDAYLAAARKMSKVASIHTIQATPADEKLSKKDKNSLSSSTEGSGEFKRLLPDFIATFSALETEMEALGLDIEKQNIAVKERSEDTVQTSKTILIVGMVLIAILLITLSSKLLNLVMQPINKVLKVFSNIENGNYDTPIVTTSNDELSNLLQSLDGLQKKLGDDLIAKEAFARQVEAQKTLYENELAAIKKSTGVVDMDLDGKITDANEIFLDALGYSREEVVGVDPHEFMTEKDLNNGLYHKHWDKVLKGESFTEQIKRVGKDGKEVWLDATYNPIISCDGEVCRVVKVVHYARDITEQKIKDLDFIGQINAIGRSQGVIEIDLQGYILKANQTYCDMLGYQEKDLKDNHVSVVLDPTYANSPAYSQLWSKLTSGGTDAGQYKRIAKDGKEVWIQASYNPIKDEDGKIIKIVNYTIDITEDKLAASDKMSQIAAINKVQGVIEFDLTGKVLAVNDNFVAVTGYTKEEILGNHHSMFVEASYKTSPEYKAFWEKLASGVADESQYKRIGKGGKVVWLQATYNPIFDLNGKPYKVVKFATDITTQYNIARALELAVEESQTVIENAKSGDLTSRVSLDGKTGAIASLCDGINALMDKMTEVIAQVREAGETINTAANEIATGNNDLSSRTEQQASSLEETASSMEELSSTVKQNAENAKQANQLAAAASGVAVKGGEVVGNVVTTMADINNSARKIEDIISVIDGIAFQTNILALNAAVEAARAGEQGRGFAVVAGEVRNLAQRSASAAKEIKELITDSVSKTAEGTKLVESAGSTMQEIVASVQRVTDIMGEISAASSEQSAGIDQVNNAITSMDEVTQQNSALVEEATAAAESLVEQAASLMDTVSAFRLAAGNAYNNQAKRNERRSNNSSMRASAPTSKPAFKPAAKVAAKTGTYDSEWEEF